MHPLRAISEIWNRLRASITLRSGIRMYQAGHLQQATERLEASLALAGPSYDAHLHLGRIHLRQGQFDRARQEFAQARFLDPRRFAADGVPEALLEAAERIYQPAFTIEAEAEFDEDLGPFDDFSSAAERERFRNLPAIQTCEIESVDWERLADEFGR